MNALEAVGGECCLGQVKGILGTKGMEISFNDEGTGEGFGYAQPKGQETLDEP